MQSGRFHMYEGHTADETALPIRVFARARRAVPDRDQRRRRHPLESFAPGTVMLIRDHLNLTGRTPLEGPVLPGEQRFPDMSVAYDAKLRRLAQEAAQRARVAARGRCVRGTAGAELRDAGRDPLARACRRRCGRACRRCSRSIAARARRMKVLGLLDGHQPRGGPRRGKTVTRRGDGSRRLTSGDRVGRLDGSRDRVDGVIDRARARRPGRARMRWRAGDNRARAQRPLPADSRARGRR